MPHLRLSSAVLRTLAGLSTVAALAVAAVESVEAQVRAPAFELEPGNRLRIHASPDAWPSATVEGVYWLVDPDDGLLVRLAREQDAYFRREQIRRIEVWVAEEGSKRTVWLTVGIGALVGAAQGARFPSEGEPYSGMAVLGALGGAGLGFIVGSVLTGDDGSWRELALEDVFDP